MSNAGVANHQDVPKAIVLTLISIFIFGIQDIFVKMLVVDYSTTQLVMIRFWGVALFTLIWVLRTTKFSDAIRSHFPLFQIVRSVLLLVDIWLFTAALGYIQTSDVQALFMIYPVLVSVLAVPMLGERMGMWRWGAVFIGFVGAMIVIRPGFQQVELSHWLVIGAVVSFSIYTVLTRLVATRDSTKTSMLYLALVALVLSTATGIFNFEWMDATSWMLMGGVIICAISTHILFTAALKFAPAGTLQPFNFLSLPVAVLLTFLFFGHVTDAITLFGGALTIFAGIIVWARERRIK
ncbi:DMT family transporter [Maritalea sp.]|uniref:DMT family transporter n=1 Tax=Maritalea sp. TaxID=2003361 RepID=UPI003EF89274